MTEKGALRTLKVADFLSGYGSKIVYSLAGLVILLLIVFLSPSPERSQSLLTFVVSSLFVLIGAMAFVAIVFTEFSFFYLEKLGDSQVLVLSKRRGYCNPDRILFVWRGEWPKFKFLKPRQKDVVINVSFEKSVFLGSSDDPRESYAEVSASYEFTDIERFVVPILSAPDLYGAMESVKSNVENYIQSMSVWSVRYPSEEFFQTAFEAELASLGIEFLAGGLRLREYEVDINTSYHYDSESK